MCLKTIDYSRPGMKEGNFGFLNPQSGTDLCTHL